MNRAKKMLKKAGRSAAVSERVRENIKRELGIVDQPAPAPVRRSGRRVRAFAYAAAAVVLSALVAVPFLLPAEKSAPQANVITLSITGGAVSAPRGGALFARGGSGSESTAVQFDLDSALAVSSVRGLNRKGTVLVYGESYGGRTADAAAEAAVSEAARLGLIPADASVRIVAVGEDAGKEQTLMESAAGGAQRALDAAGLTGVEIGGLGEADEAAAERLGVTVGKYRVIAALIEKDPRLKEKKLAKEDVDDLLEMLEDYDEEAHDRLIGDLASAGEFDTERLRALEAALEDLEDLEDDDYSATAVGKFLEKYAEYASYFDGREPEEAAELLEEKLEEELDELEDVHDALKKQFLGDD